MDFTQGGGSPPPLRVWSPPGGNPLMWRARVAFSQLLVFILGSGDCSGTVLWYQALLTRPMRSQSLPARPCAHSKQWKPIKFDGFSLIFIGFHWFSLIFTDFHWFFMIICPELKSIMSLCSSFGASTAPFDACDSVLKSLCHLLSWKYRLWESWETLWLSQSR